MPKPGKRAANRLMIRFVTAKLKAATHLLRKRIRRMGTSTSTRSKMTHAVIRISNCLYHCRYPLHRLLSRSQRDEGDADDNKYNGADEFSACDQVTECLHRHKRGVRKARPCRECDQAAIRRWVTRSQQQEDAECDVNAEHHRQRRLLLHKHHQG